MARLKNVFMVFMLLGKRMKIFVQEMEKKKNKEKKFGHLSIKVNQNFLRQRRSTKKK